MNSAWNSNGDVTKIYGIPWAGIRKGFFTYKNIVSTLLKLTLNGVFYDFEKQAKEGLVVLGEQYKTVTFFLPEDKSPMTLEDGNNMTINSYFEMLSTTSYSNIIAWDFFAKFLSDAIANNSTEESDIVINSEIQYVMTSINNSNIMVSGAGVFNNITCARDFFNVIYTTMSQDNSSLSNWMEEDGTVAAKITFTAGEDSMFFDFYIGKK